MQAIYLLLMFYAIYRLYNIVCVKGASFKEVAIGGTLAIVAFASFLHFTNPNLGHSSDNRYTVMVYYPESTERTVSPIAVACIDTFNNTEVPNEHCPDMKSVKDYPKKTNYLYKN